MNDKKSWTRKIGDFLAGKGFYVVLLICTVVIGLSAWVLLFTGNKIDEPEPGSIASAPVSQDVLAPSNGGDADAFSTDTLGQKPTVTPSKPSESAKPTASASPSAAPASPKPSSGGGNNNSSGEDKSAAAMAKQLTFTWPVIGDITVVYSVDELIYSMTMSDWRTHDGIDIAGAIGTKVLAAADGTVEDVYVDDLLGTTVVIDHGDGLKSVYANLAATPVVETGDKVAMGAVIGAIGDTAIGETNDPSHLHFAMKKDDLPADPIKYLPKK